MNEIKHVYSRNRVTLWDLFFFFFKELEILVTSRYEINNLTTALNISVVSNSFR